MNKFRVGDKVRVKNNINSKNWIGIYEFDEKMEKYIGEKLTISSYEGDCYLLSECILNEEDWAWEEDMLELWKPCTNYERIKNMTIEEMAEMLIKYDTNDYWFIADGVEIKGMKNAIKKEIEWLNSDVD